MNSLFIEQCRELDNRMRGLSEFIKETWRQAYEAGYKDAEVDHVKELICEAMDRVVGEKKDEWNHKKRDS